MLKASILKCMTHIYLKGSLALTIILAAWAFLVPLRAFSQQQPQSTPSLGGSDLYIYGSYRAEVDQPFTFKDVTAADLEPKNFGQEPSNILAQTPSVTAYSDSGSYQGYSYFRLRGIDQTRINMSLDGVPLNEPEDQGAYFSNYPDFFSSISRFQLIRGVSTSQNGVASYGGSLLFDSFDLRQPKRFQLGQGIGAFGSYQTHAAYNSGQSDGQGLYLRATNQHSDGYKYHSGNDAQSVFYKLGSTAGRNAWILSGFVGQQANELAYLGSTEQEIENDRRHNANTEEEDDRFIQSLTQLQHVNTDAAGNILTSSIYYNHLDGGYDFDLNNFLGIPSNGELYNYHFSSNFLGAFSNYQIDLSPTKVTLGVHGNLYEREHVGSELSLGELYQNKGRKNEASAFAKIEHTVGDFVLLGDLQLRYTNFDYSGSVPLEELNWTFFNPKVGATYLMTDSSNFYYSVGKSGREPTRNDILAGNDDLLADEEGNPITGVTQAEHVIDHELGFRSRGEAWDLKANAYYMDFDHEIVLNGKLGPNGLPLTSSVDQSYRRGLELDFAWEPAIGWALSTNASYNHSQIETAGEKFAPVMTPEWIVNQGIEYKIDAFSLGANLRYQSSAYIDFANANKIGGFFVTDLSLHYRYENLLFGVFLNNLFDEKYVSNGYLDVNQDARYFVQAPRNVYLSVTWRLS